MAEGGPSGRERGLEIPWPRTSRAPIVLGMVDAEILAYYEHGLERDRLASGRQRIEFLRIWDLLERCLPAAPAKVLDVGGGAGAYAIPLASAGYEVHLIDPVPLHVEQAAAASRKAGKALAGISAGDARDLPAADGSADAVLLLGPLYHLTSREDRLTALREARRVLRPGGTVVAKALSRFYPVFEELAGGMPVSPEGLDGTARFLADGQYRNPGGDPALSQLLDIPESRDHVLSVLRLLEDEPSLIGMSQNFVAIAQAPAGD